MKSNFHSRDFSDRNLGNAVINHMLTASANFTLSGPRLPTYISPSLPRLPRLVSGAPHKDFRPGNRPAPNAKHVAMVTPESVDLECTLAFHLSLYDQDTIQTWRRSHLHCNPLAQSDQSQPIHCSQGPTSLHVGWRGFLFRNLLVKISQVESSWRSAKPCYQNCFWLVLSANRNDQKKVTGILRRP